MSPSAMLLPIALLGLFLGLLTVWQRRLVPAIVVHVAVAVVALGGRATSRLTQYDWSHRLVK